MDRKCSGFLLLLALAPFLFWSGKAEAEPLSLAQAVRRSIERSPGVHAGREGVKVAEARENKVLSMRLPRVDFEESYLRTDQPVATFGSLLNQGRFTAALLTDPALTALNHPDSLDNFRTRFALTQPLFTGGELFYRQGMSKGETEAATWDLEGVRAMTAFHAVESYWGLSLARESEHAAREAVRTAEENLREIEALYNEGTVVRSDLLLAKVQLADFRDQLVKTGGRIRVAEVALNLLVGEPESGTWEVAQLCVPGTGEIQDVNPARLLERAKQGRPEYVALRTRWAASEKGVKAAQGSFLPHLGLEASYEWNAPKFTSDLEGAYILGVGFQWNLFRGFGDLAGVQEARSRQGTLGYELRRMEDRITMEIQEAVVAVRTGMESLDVTRERVEMSEESLRIVSQRYREGVTTIVELEQTEWAVSRSRMAWFEVIHDLRIALARLRFVTGELLLSMKAETCSSPPAD
jgi:outer membrane protein TolC